MMTLPYEEFTTKFSRMRDAYLELQTERARNQLFEAPEFNIFQVLNVSRDEVRHSAFLCHLLSPTESHGQGFLLLANFLQYCTDKFPEFPPVPPVVNPNTWLVTTELPTHFGRMDIVIQNPIEGFLLVIENKVDASEGPKQLERYGRWMDNHRKVYPHQALCFLTIEGGPSFTAEDYVYHRLSYRHDIAGWLESTLEQVQASAVQILIRQYLGIVTTL